MALPHQGALYRVEGEQDMTTCAIEIKLEDSSTYELKFRRKDYDFSARLFAIMDVESIGEVSKATVKEFVTLRCPVFWRRDDDLQQQPDSRPSGVGASSPTFEEVWKAVIDCSLTRREALLGSPFNDSEIGLEAWMVFCRFIALAQYLEAKRRFSGRHLQQTMRHRNAPRGSEVVVVEVPPPAPPLPLLPSELARYERDNNTPLPMPELDLDHSLLAAHDVLQRRKNIRNMKGLVKVVPFGSKSSSSGTPSASTKFCLTYSRYDESSDMSAEEDVSVLRSIDDLKWLNDTFASHKKLGGTLCGRILPPFPGGSIGKASLLPSFSGDDCGSSASDSAISAAAASVGYLKKGIKSGIKSLWGSYVASSPSASVPQPSSAQEPNRSQAIQKKSSTSSSRVRYDRMYDSNSPEGKARRIERYLNYLLEHPALSTSFPLNTMLKASQSGLDAAKQSLEEHARASREIDSNTPRLDDGKPAFWPIPGSSSGASQPNLSWVRTAAQAAMALKLHGILETTGMPSASARLQHASLPAFHSSRNSAWVDEEGRGPPADAVKNFNDEASLEDSFEEGVLHVQDELEAEVMADDDAGYDLLPLPVPAPERAILSIGEGVRIISNEPRGNRFRYGSPSIQSQLGMDNNNDDDGRPAFLGDIAVDENIDKLREVIGSVDNTLSRCFSSCERIASTSQARNQIHLDLVRGFDSWEGLKGKFISQRALLKGMSGLEQAREIREEGDMIFADDMSWQAALAGSAVSAAEDVRSTVRASRTAANAKAAATSAAFAAQSACESTKFTNIDEARAAHTRASIAQSHAIHAAVVEHEAKTVKRRATLALANDVKCWNTLRKREMLQSCLAFAKSQHESSRRAVDSWSHLKDGYIGSPVLLSAAKKRVSMPPGPMRMYQPRASRQGSGFSNDEPTATIFHDAAASPSEHARPMSIIPSEHDLFQPPPTPPTPNPNTTDIFDQPSPTSPPQMQFQPTNAAASDTTSQSDAGLPLAVASPIPEDDNFANAFDDLAGLLDFPAFGSNSNAANTGLSSPSSQLVIPSPDASQVSEKKPKSEMSASHRSISSSNISVSNSVVKSYSQLSLSSQDQPSMTADATESNENLTSSMQSLVEGLMTWGGQYDSDQDFNLPAGMAASIALEESGVIGSQQIQ